MKAPKSTKSAKITHKLVKQHQEESRESSGKHHKERSHHQEYGHKK